MTIDKFNYSERHNSIWIAPPRTGSRGLSRIFGFLGFLHKKKPVFELEKLNFTHETPPIALTDNKTIITSVRNPYGRLYSMYLNYFPNPYKLSFKSFVLNLDNDISNHNANQFVNIVPNYVIRLENLYDDLLEIPMVQENLSKKQIKLFTTHGRDLYDWEIEYDDEMKEKIYMIFKKQFEMFGYEK